jgi:hypothetical protein
MVLLGVTDHETVSTLTAYARVARQRGWWDDPDLRPHLTPALRQLIQYEAEATTIRCFQPTLVPGALQTPDYARAILDFWVELPEETRSVRQTVRAERHNRLFGRPDRPRYLLLLDESVVQRQVGGPAVMAEQLRALLAKIRSGEITLRIVPLIHGANLGPTGGFTILDLDEDESAILYREIGLDDDNVRDERETVEHYRRAFERMWDVALAPDASTSVIEASAATLNASIVRPRIGE